MEAARKFIQIVRAVLAVSIVMYVLMILQIPSSATPNPVMLRALGFVAITEAIFIVVLRRIQILSVETLLESQPKDPKALLRWRQGYIITYCLSLSIALYGVVLHFLGFLLSQVAPFFVAGLVLILFLGPKAIPNDASSQSGPIVPH